MKKLKTIVFGNISNYQVIFNLLKRQFAFAHFLISENVVECDKFYRAMYFASKY